SIDYRNPDVFKSLGKFKTDRTGRVDIPAGGQNNRRIGFLLRTGNDEYYEAPQYRYTGNTRNSTQYNARINTGRAIYKPGETIHLQGIVLIREEKSGIHRLDFSKKRVEIILRNQQNQVIHEEELTIDEFGSFEASLTLPATTLPGQFHVHVASDGLILGHRSIRVEEYKAPKYQIVLNSVGEEGDSMVVEGNVNAIAGYPLTNAKASCEVHLQKSNWWSRIPGNMEADKELILTTVLETDENGRFLFKWPIRPIRSDYFISYLVNVRVQDETGEVMERSLFVPLNQDQIRVNWGNLDEKSDLRELQTTKIQFENAKGELLKLNAQWRLSFKEFKTHCHQCPEYLVNGRNALGKKKDCQRAQGYYDCKVNNDTTNYKLLSEGEILAGQPFFQPQKYVKSAGQYKLELFTKRDSFSKVFSWNSVEQGQQDSDNPLVFFLADHRAHAGQEIMLLLNKSVDEDLYVRYMVHQNNEIIEQKWLTVSGFLQLNIPVLESYRGNFGIYLSTVYKNKFYSKNEKVEVPFSNKQLNVEFIKWPKKAGTKEKQKIMLQVKDDFGRPVETQFAVSIYDKKLDEMLPHAWTANYYPNYPNYLHLRAKTGERESIYHLGFSQKDEFEYQVFGNYRLKDIFDTDSPTPQLAYELSESVDMNQLSSRKMEGHNRQMKAEPEQKLEDATANSFEERPATHAPTLRSNLNTLMYFNGHIKTDSEGIAEIEFKTNDAISNWAVLLHGHSKDLSYHVSKEEFQTYQPVLVEPNLPRFLHEGDEMVLTAKVVNRTGKPLELVPKAAFYTEDSKNLTYLEILEDQDLVIAGNSSSSFNARLKVPSGSEKIALRFSAEGESYADAVEETLPVRSNTVELVTSIPIRTYQGKTTWDKEALSALLNNADFSVDKVALEYTAHEHIPLLISLTGTFEEEERFASEIFDKWQAFMLVEYLLQKTPKIKMLFEDMKARQIPINPMADLSDYRIVDVDQSKWAAAGEKTNEILYRQLSQLLNDRLRQSEIQRLWRKLKARQNRDGGIKWCSNARNSSFSTSLHVAENYLRMLQLELFERADDQFIQSLMTYLSDYFVKIERDEERSLMSYDRYLLSYALSWINWQGNTALWDPSHYIDSVKADFMKYPVGLQARLGLFLENHQDPMLDTLLQSLVERSIYDPTVGRFWNATGGWNWGEWKLNAHSWLFELFLKSGFDEKWLMEMKQWLVSQKQGNAWRNAGQTGDAAISFCLSPGQNMDFINLSISRSGKRIDEGFPYFFSEWHEVVNMEDVQIENHSDFGYGAFIVKYRAT
ncbi:MAG TPA: alpha-2-macroglobulin family protein, partial [Saprospiraceae bacterium]|nr:alpha-2-macroglobulin family protein [Saprospiraceae bacterium]